MTNTIIMQNDDLPENADNWTILHRNGNAPQVPFWKLNEGFEIDINDYHAIARVSGPAVKGGDLLYRLTNNVDESWSRDFAGSHDDEHWGAWEMEVADLHTDSNGKEWGHRSSMPADIYIDNATKQAWIVCGVGWSWIGEVELDYGVEWTLSNDPRHQE
jgi:hypothetical protein